MSNLGFALCMLALCLLCVVRFRFAHRPWSQASIAALVLSVYPVEQIIEEGVSMVLLVSIALAGVFGVLTYSIARRDERVDASTRLPSTS